MKVPCKDCALRTQGCHSHCQAYLDYTERLEVIRKERLATYQLGAYVEETILKWSRRANKR